MDTVPTSTGCRRVRQSSIMVEDRLVLLRERAIDLVVLVGPDTVGRLVGISATSIP